MASNINQKPVDVSDITLKPFDISRIRSYQRLVPRRKLSSEDEIPSTSKKIAMDIADLSCSSNINLETVDISKETYSEKLIEKAPIVKLPSEDKIPASSNEIILFDLDDLTSASNTNQSDDCNIASFFEQSVKEVSSRRVAFSDNDASDSSHSNQSHTQASAEHSAETAFLQESSIIHINDFFSPINVADSCDKDDSSASKLIQDNGNIPVTPSKVSSRRVAFSDIDAWDSSSHNNHSLTQASGGCSDETTFLQSIKESPIIHMNDLCSSINVANSFDKDDFSASKVIQDNGNKPVPPSKASSIRVDFSDNDVSDSSSHSNHSLTQASGERSNETSFLPNLSDYSCSDTTIENSSEYEFVDAKTKNIGFLGLGEIGSVLAKKLLNTGHYLTVWDESNEKCAEFLRYGAKLAKFPADVILRCDITICCASDPEAVYKIVYGKKGVIEGFNKWNKEGYKAYVEMTSLDPQLSKKIGLDISDKSGRFLEATVADVGNISEECNSKLILCAGNRRLLMDFSTCFSSVCDNVLYMGHNVGDASKLKVISNMIIATHHAGLREAMLLLQSKGLSPDVFMHLLSRSSLSSPAALKYGYALLGNDARAISGLKYLQRDVFVANSLKQSHSFFTSELNSYLTRAKQVDYETLAAKCKESV